MHPAPSLAESFPRSDAPRSGRRSDSPDSKSNQRAGRRSKSPDSRNPSLEPHSGRQFDSSPDSRTGQRRFQSPDSRHQSLSASPPARKDTNSSTSTSATSVTFATIASADTAGTTFSVDSSPTYQTSQQPVFSVRDGGDGATVRRTNRRRTGPLSAPQREKAALIRKLGACQDCRRRRVACHPNHHNMTWEQALDKFSAATAPSLPAFPVNMVGRPLNPRPLNGRPLSGRPLSPAPPLNGRPTYTHDPQEMDIDNSSTPQPGRPPSSETRPYRTPLPSGPRPERPLAAAPAPPTLESLKADLQGMATRIMADPWRSRYGFVHVLLLYWQDEPDAEVVRQVDELALVLDKHYHYTFDITAIPASSDGCQNSWRWLSRKITDLVDNRDQRDVLKVVYYNGHSYLDGNREMVLACPGNGDPASAIRWSGIQQILEEARADTLILMDSTYYPSARMVRHQGVLELIAASASEDHAQLLGRCSFTRALTEELRMRAVRGFMKPFSAAELHAKLLSEYPKIIHDRYPERETVTSFPSPLHILMTGNARLPSILLAPLLKGRPYDYQPTALGPQVNLSFKFTDDNPSIDGWTEWLRAMPEGVRDFKVESTYRPTFR